MRTKLKIIAVIILMFGFGSAILIYNNAKDESNNIYGYEETDGNIYPILAEDSKKYSYDLELYSGKAGVLADELRRWFIGLWEGEHLAIMIGILSVVASFCLFYIASHAFN